MNLKSLIIGGGAFLLIGLFHPIVIKAEYHIGKKVWPVFLICGVLLLIIALLVDGAVVSPLISVTGFTCLWSIQELWEQEKRVRKGWFPSNPKKDAYLKRNAQRIMD